MRLDRKSVVTLKKQVPVQIAVLIVVARRVEDDLVRTRETGMRQEHKKKDPATGARESGDRVAEPLGATADQEKTRRGELKDQPPVKWIATDRRGKNRQYDRHHEHDPCRQRPPRQGGCTDREDQKREQHPGPGGIHHVERIDEDLEQDAHGLVSPFDAHRQRPDRWEREIPEPVHRSV